MKWLKATITWNTGVVCNGLLESRVKMCLTVNGEPVKEAHECEYRAGVGGGEEVEEAVSWAWESLFVSPSLPVNWKSAGGFLSASTPAWSSLQRHTDTRCLLKTTSPNWANKWSCLKASSPSWPHDQVSGFLCLQQHTYYLMKNNHNIPRKLNQLMELHV